MRALDFIAGRLGFVPKSVAAVAVNSAVDPWFDVKTAGYQSFSTTDGEAISRWFGAGTYAGPTVTSESAMQQITVFTCVRILAETIGGLPAKFYERDAAGNANPIDYDLGSVLLERPNSDMDSVNFTESGMVNLALEGNNYCLIGRTGKRISSLYPIAADCAYPKRDADGNVVFRVNDRGRWETYTRDEIWQTKGFGDDGLKGFSPIGYMRQMIGMALATEEWQARFFSQGAQPSWLLSVPGWLKDNERVMARKNLQDMMGGGTANAYRAMLLEGGMTATAATMNLVDAQFMELKKMTREEIFGAYRIPPHMGGELSRATNNNIEQQALEFVTYAVMPYLTRIESSVSRWLIPPQDRGRVFLRFNVEGLLRADATARGELYNKLLMNGVITRNQVRAIEKWNRSDAPGMDDYTVQSAMVPVDLLRLVAERAASAPVAPPALTPLTPGKDAKPDEYKELREIIQRIGRAGSDELEAKKHGGTYVINVLQQPDTSISVMPADVKANVTVEGATVQVASPGVKVDSPVSVAAPDMAAFAGAMQKLAEVGNRIADDCSRCWARS